MEVLALGEDENGLARRDTRQCRHRREDLVDPGREERNILRMDVVLVLALDGNLGDAVVVDKTQDRRGVVSRLRHNGIRRVAIVLGGLDKARGKLGGVEEEEPRTPLGCGDSRLHYFGESLVPGRYLIGTKRDKFLNVENTQKHGYCFTHRVPRFHPFNLD